MSTSVTDSGTLPGSAITTIGGALLVLTAAISLFAFLGGDFMTGGAVLLYVPVAALLVAIGRKRDLV